MLLIFRKSSSLCWGFRCSDFFHQVAAITEAPWKIVMCLKFIFDCCLDQKIGSLYSTNLRYVVYVHMPLNLSIAIVLYYLI